MKSKITTYNNVYSAHLPYGIATTPYTERGSTYYMKKIFLIALTSLIVDVGFAQDTLDTPTQSAEKLDRYPDTFKEINFGAELQKQFDNRELIYKRINNDSIAHKDLSQGEKELLNKLGETFEDQWDVAGGGCSWYCGGGPKLVTSSSELSSTKEEITYAANNAHDLNYKNAWAEGKEGYGIGEYLTYTFEARSPRITSIIVANGYVKSEAAYKNNSRVKRLAVYKDDNKIAILNLKDIRGKQSFSFSPIGNTRTESYNAETNSWHTDIDLEPGDWKLIFEILEVYKGDKYDDTVISEIYFDGIDVH